MMKVKVTARALSCKPSAWAVPLVCWLLLVQVHPPACAGDLAATFQNPPTSARPQVWWHWMNGHISREGITRELESLKNAGMGDFTLFSGSGFPSGTVTAFAAAPF